VAIMMTRMATRQHGATVIEYVIIAAFVSIVAMVTISHIGQKVSDKISGVSSAFPYAP